MNVFIKVYIVLALFLVSITTQVSAQTRRSTTKTNKTVKKTTGRTINKNIPKKRISSTKVTYKTPKKKVASVRTVPNKSVIKHKGQDYYYANNNYYTESRGRYIVITPKIGFRIKSLPSNYKHSRSILYSNK